jgi:Ca2+-binding EF-hand superfamily protein
MADTSQDGMLSLVEIQKFLKKIEVNFSYEELKTLFKVRVNYFDYTNTRFFFNFKNIDRDHDGKFSEYEFLEFMNELITNRPGVTTIFKK